MSLSYSTFCLITVPPLMVQLLWSHGDVLTSAALTGLRQPTAGFMTDSFLLGTLRAALLPLFFRGREEGYTFATKLLLYLQPVADFRFSAAQHVSSYFVALEIPGVGHGAGSLQSKETDLLSRLFQVKVKQSCLSIPEAPCEALFLCTTMKHTPPCGRHQVQMHFLLLRKIQCRGHVVKLCNVQYFPFKALTFGGGAAKS